MVPRIVSGVPQGSVGSSSVHPLYQWNLWAVGEQTICLCWFLEVVRKPADRPAVAASLNKDLARILEWYNHWCLILNPNKTKSFVVIVYPGLSTIPMVTWTCLGFPFALVPTLAFLAWSLTSSSHLKTMCVVCLSCLSKNWYFEVGEACLCEHLCVASLLLCICSPNPRVLFYSMGVCCWMLSSASRAPGVFGGQALPWSDFLVVV